MALRMGLADPVFNGKIEMEFSRLVYGLAIRSSLPLIELPVCGGTSDVVVRLDNIRSSDRKPANEGERHKVTSDGVFLFYEGVGTFLVRGGHEIIVDPAQDVDEGIVRLFILGPALGVLLHQRGKFILHGSAVTTNGSAVAFLGEEESGKSTLAAALYTRGHSVVTDDVIVVQIEKDCKMVFPGFSYIKLQPEMANLLGGFLKNQSISYPQLGIKAYCVDKGFPSKPLPLSRIYVLNESEDKKIEVLEPQKALMELIRHSYCARLIANEGAPLHFLQCSTLVNSIPIFRLNRPRSLSALPDVVRMVENDLAHG